MDENELLSKINELERVAKTLDEPEKTFKLCEISQLRIEAAGMAISDVAAKMKAISLPRIEEMDTQIAAAADATSAHSARVAAFDSAYRILKGFLGLVV